MGAQAGLHYSDGFILPVDAAQGEQAERERFYRKSVRARFADRAENLPHPVSSLT